MNISEVDKEKAKSLASKLSLMAITGACKDWELIIAKLFYTIRKEAAKEAARKERERDVAGEVWDVIERHLPTKGRTAIYDEMRAKFPIPTILTPESASEKED